MAIGHLSDSVLIKSRKRKREIIQFNNGRKRTVKVATEECKNQTTEPTPVDVAEAGPSNYPCNSTSEGKKVRDYSQTKLNRIEQWSKLMPQMVQAHMESNCPSGESCSICSQPLVEKFRCIDCLPTSQVCKSCLLTVHSRPHLHVFEGWKNGTYYGYDCESPVWKRPIHNCQSQYQKALTVVDSFGRQHRRVFIFCQCEAEVITLIRHQLWPSTPTSPTIAFHFELMKWYYGLLLEGHVSLKSFCAGLSTRQSKHEKGYTNREIINVYKVLVTDTTDQFRYFWYQQQYGFGEQYAIKIDNGTECPACFEIDTKVLSMDADFQLVRKLSSGKSWNQPKHKEKFFLNQDAVDDFMAGQQTKPEKEKIKECSDFQAGNSLRSKVKNSKLSETAVFGSVCRHEFPQSFFSLRHGERLGYPIYMIKHFLEKQSTSDTKVHITYDIACLLAKHIKGNPSYASMLEKIILSIPVFHCYGHQYSCQILYNPRKTMGLGLTDGESIERLWSYLGGFSKITKEMTPENRVDLLTDGLLNYGRKLKESLGETIIRKNLRAKKIEEESQSLLTQILAPFPEITNIRLEEWCNEEKNGEQNQEEKDTRYTWQEDYVVSQMQLKNLKLEVELNHQSASNIPLNCEKEIERLEKKISSVEKKKSVKWNSGDPSFVEALSSAEKKKEKKTIQSIKQILGERKYLLRLIKKYAKGQSIAIRLNRQLTQATKELEKKIREYNTLSKGQKVSMADVSELCDGDSKNVASEVEKIKSEAVNLYCMTLRAREEQVLLVKECNSIIQWHIAMHCNTMQAIQNDEHSISLKSFLVKDAIHHECAIKHYQAVYEIIKGQPHEVNFITKFSCEIPNFVDINTLLQDVVSDGDFELEEADDITYDEMYEDGESDRE